jgi:hypothetical protein
MIGKELRYPFCILKHEKDAIFENMLGKLFRIWSYA